MRTSGSPAQSASIAARLSPSRTDGRVKTSAARSKTPTSERSQAEWLRAHGIEELVDAALAGWRERAHVGDLDALRHRSRVGEADALLDPDGLGDFRVLEWVV